MRISFGTRFDAGNIDVKNGYGYATKCMLESLDRLGYQVSFNDASADVEIWFDQPHWWDFSDGPYKIGYHPWESTLLLPGWADTMNQCDEIWTPSPLIADWYKRYNSISVPGGVHVYEHGIEHDWEPYKRSLDGPITFLHVGAEAARKGGWDMPDAFRKAFPEKHGRRLTLKMIKANWNGIPSLGGINYLNEKMDFEELRNLFYSNHVYVYPSWGEGFGLTPLQAMATGMPTITLPGWAPYSPYLDPELSVGHTMHRSPWPEIHPGDMMKPNLDDVVDAMRHVDANYDRAVDYSMRMAREVHEMYDWDTITKRVFTDLENRLR